MSRFADISGQRFGCTVVIAVTDKKWGRYQWLCRCDCGQEHISDGAALRRGAVVSCGCKVHIKHGQARKGKVMAEYSVWVMMRQRCTNPKVTRYRHYGGRGISVCERWDSFESFFSDMGPRPGPKYSIDRINNDGNYEPSNCRWATAKQQSENRTIARGSDGCFSKGRA